MDPLCSQCTVSWKGILSWLKKYFSKLLQTLTMSSKMISFFTPLINTMTKHFTIDDAIGTLIGITTQWPLTKIHFRCQGLYKNPICLSALKLALPTQKQTFLSELHDSQKKRSCKEKRHILKKIHFSKKPKASQTLRKHQTNNTQAQVFGKINVQIWL